MVVLLMGVAGSGKTTIGRTLAKALGWSFRDADEFHPSTNIAKMSAGQPLDDRDRAPWLAAIRTHIDATLARDENAVVACSALKASYRTLLVADPTQVKLVHLTGDPALLAARIGGRLNHFMGPGMLASQLAALQSPRAALTVDIAQPPAAIVAQIRRELNL